MNTNKSASLNFTLALITCAFIFARLIAPANTNNLASFINPFIGTANSGNTYPGAVAPFGSVQMTPNLAGNGYYYRSTHMHGFVVNHMSGDGGQNEGQVLLTATTGAIKVDRPSTDYH